MPIQYIVRRPAFLPGATAKAYAAPIIVDSDDNKLKFIPAGSGTTEVEIIDASTSQTLTNKTLTSPTITGATVSAAINSDLKVLAATATATTNVVLATLTGFSWTLVAGGTYQFELELPSTMTTNGGLKLAFTLTTATLTSIRYNTYQSTATDNGTAVSSTGTTATSGTAPIDNKTAAYTTNKVTGALVVNAGGTFEWQFCQNTSHSDTTSILIGSTAKMVRVA